MVDVSNILNTLIKGLNSIDNSFIFIRSNQIGKLPQYPYGIVNVLSSYIQEKDTLRGEIQYENTDNGMVMQRVEDYQLTFSLTFYSNDYDEVFSIIKKVSDWLLLQGRQYLSEHDIILLERTTYTDRGSMVLVNEYHYKYGFDIRVRVRDIIEMNVETIESVEVDNKNDGSKIEIGGN